MTGVTGQASRVEPDGRVVRRWYCAPGRHMYEVAMTTTEATAVAARCGVLDGPCPQCERTQR